MAPPPVELVEARHEVVLVGEVRAFQRDFQVTLRIAPDQARIDQSLAADAVGQLVVAIGVDLGLVAPVHARR